MYKKVILPLAILSSLILTSCSDNFTVTASGTHVTIDPASAQEVASGDPISFTVTADTGYTLSSTVGGTCAQGSWEGTTYTTGAIVADCTIDFSASSNIVHHTVTPSGTNVTIDPSTAQSITDNDTVSFTVTANLGYTIYPTVGGTCSSGTWDGDIYTTGTITSDCTVTFSAHLPLKIFVTSSTWDGQLGQAGDPITLAAIDALCMADANKPAGGGTYKAMFASTTAGQTRIACTTSSCSGGAVENTNWIMLPNTNYYRANGTTLIGTTNSGGVFPLENGQTLSNSISSGASVYWTGMGGYSGTGSWVTNASFTCSNWTSVDMFGVGTEGDGTSVSGSANLGNGVLYTWQQPCNTARSLVCVEQ